MVLPGIATSNGLNTIIISLDFAVIQLADHGVCPSVQRDNLFYPSWAFAVPNLILLQIPQAVVESFIWSGIVYWVGTPSPWSQAPPARGLKHLSVAPKSCDWCAGLRAGP